MVVMVIALFLLIALIIKLIAVRNEIDLDMTTHAVLTIVFTVILTIIVYYI